MPCSEKQYSSEGVELKAGISFKTCTSFMSTLIQLLCQLLGLLPYFLYMQSSPILFLNLNFAILVIAKIDNFRAHIKSSCKRP